MIVIFYDRTEKLQGDLSRKLFVSAPALREQRMILARSRLHSWPSRQNIFSSQSARFHFAAHDLFAHMKCGLRKEAFLVSAGLQLPGTERPAHIVHKVSRADAAQRDPFAGAGQRVQANQVARFLGSFRKQFNLRETAKWPAPSAGWNVPILSARRSRRFCCSFHTAGHTGTGDSKRTGRRQQTSR